MLYSYKVNLTEKDYYEFNQFLQTKSHYGKKTHVFIRRISVVTIVLVTILLSVYDDFNICSLIVNMFACCIAILFIQIFGDYFCNFSLKMMLKLIKKTGKMAFSPFSEIEFGENYFCETTSENRTECSYSAIERISIIDGKIIYIHINHAMAYLLPYSVFENQIQYRQFINFLNTKCCNIDWYNK